MPADSLKIVNPDERIFQSWGTVEVVDKDNQVLPISEFEGIMPIMMDRGGELMYAHSNKKVGKILNYEFADKKLEDGSTAKGVLITGKVFKNYKFDDEVWKKVLNKQIKGLSFGGRQSNQLDKSYETIRGKPAEIIGSIEGFEFSLVENPANQEATMTFVNNIAKEDESMKRLAQMISDNLIKDFSNKSSNNMEIKKPFADYSSMEDCMNKNSDKENPQAYCSTIMRQAEGNSTQTNTGDNMEEQKSAPEEQKKGEALSLNVEEITKKFEDSSKRFETIEKSMASVTEGIATLSKSFQDFAAKSAGVTQEEVVKMAVEEVKKSFTVGNPTPRPETADVSKGIKDKEEDSIYKIALGEKKIDMNTFREAQSQAVDASLKGIFN